MRTEWTVVILRADHSQDGSPLDAYTEHVTGHSANEAITAAQAKVMRDWDETDCRPIAVFEADTEFAK